MSNKFQILWIDNLQVRRTALSVGDNVIGNIIDADGESESIIEPAAVITLSTDDKIAITPCNGVSCYVKSYGSSRWRSVFANDTLQLKVKDTCSLHPVKIWLRVLSTMDDSNQVSSPKRKLEVDVEDEPVDKRCRSEVPVEIEPLRSIACNSNHEPLDEEDVIEGVYNDTTLEDLIDSTSETESQMQPNSFLGTVGNINEENNLELKDEGNIQHSEEHNSDSENVQQNDNREEATNNDNADTNNQATNANTQSVPREKCRYGDKCYRHNQEHKDKFSHPGDADYDQPDNRPECPYGVKCYRKNPQHKLDYKHTRLKRKPRPARAQSPLDVSDESMDESVDESDYEASFIDDSDIEEFESDFDDDE